MTTSFRLLAATALFATAAFVVTPQVSQAATPTATASATKAGPAKVRSPQQQRMADCNHQAKAEGKKGPDRKTFMSTCLRGSKSATASVKPAHKTRAKAKAAAVADSEG